MSFRWAVPRLSGGKPISWVGDRLTVESSGTEVEVEKLESGGRLIFLGDWLQAEVREEPEVVQCEEKTVKTVFMCHVAG